VLAITRKICAKRSTRARARFYKLAPKFFDMRALSPARIQIVARACARRHIAAKRERKKETRGEKGENGGVREENPASGVLLSLGRASFSSAEPRKFAGRRKLPAAAAAG